VRLFVALAPPDEVVEHADRTVAPLRSRYADLRWIPAHRWHLTLAFSGEIAADEVDGVAEMVARGLAGHGPLQLQFRGAGQFDRRALWLGVAGQVAGLKALARVVTFDRRPYRPHLTVARLRGATDARPAVAELAAYEGPGWVADSVHLVRSQLGPSPTYDTVASWPLPSGA
jgi:2'-5' RNA ligase